MARKFRKKPVVIEAIQWRYDTIANIDEIEKFIGYRPRYRNANLSSEKKIFIKTLEGELGASLMDWIIKGIKGEFYPCKPDIFNETYEEVNESVDTMKETYYEVEQFDDGTYQIAKGKDAKENYEHEIKQGDQRKRFQELQHSGK